MSTGEIVLALVRPLHAQLCSACEDAVSDTGPGEADARGPSCLRGPVARPGVPLSHTRSSASEEPIDEPRLQSPGRKRRAQSHSYSSHGRDSRPSLQSFFGNGAPSHGKGTRSDRRRHVAPRGFSSPPGLPRAWDRTPLPGPGTPLLPARVPPHRRRAPRAANGAVPWVWRARLRPGFLQATCPRRGRTQGEQRGADCPSPGRGPGPPAAGCRVRPALSGATRGAVGKRPRRLYLPSLPVPQQCHSQAAWDHTAF